jgi:acetolactate synthase-1/2/3 large subunit
VPRQNGLGSQLPKILETLTEARRPLIIAGGGVVSSQADNELLQFAEATGIPIATTFMGKGVVPETKGLTLGLIGMHGLPAANLALSNCDVLLAIGMRFSDRLTGKPEEFLPSTTIIHVDIDPAEVSKNIKAHIPVIADAKKFLQEIYKKIQENHLKLDYRPWQNTISAWQKKYPLNYQDNGLLKPQQIIEEVARQTKNESIVVTDVGQHQFFVAQYYPIGGKRSFISSGGLGTMGFGLPAAIGAGFGRPQQTVLLFTGDGSIQMNIQELATLVEHQLPVKIFLLNNNCLGMVRQWQELFFKGHYAHTIFAHQPDFCKLAEAYGLKAFKITESKDIQELVKQALAFSGPALVECVVDPEENVLPIIPPGGQPHEMLGRWKDEAHLSRIS